MNAILKLQNTIQPYAWGSRRMLAEFMNRPIPSEGPEAELWMGAHPKAPSRILTEDGWQRLDAIIRNDPDCLLGMAVRSRFGPQLPFLFKVLAVDQPLSLQAHPDKTGAEKGFHRENTLGIPLTAAHRNYRDTNHKPECICALAPFWGLCGFRPLLEAHQLLSRIWPADQQNDLELLASGWRPFYEYLMTRPPDQLRHLCTHAVQCAAGFAESEPEFQWVMRLHQHYPNDPGILAPLMLNLVRLAPGQALFLPAGQLHAYLQGMGIEIMANSDNVLRGGLTSKHMDIPELMQVLDFQPKPIQTLEARPIGPHERLYPSQVPEFRLSVITMRTGDRVSVNSGGPEIVLCTEGRVHIGTTEEGTGIDLDRGESAFITAQAGSFQASGQAEVFRAAVNSLADLNLNSIQ